jgi:hypothetical protein
MGLKFWGISTFDEESGELRLMDDAIDHVYDIANQAAQALVLEIHGDGWSNIDIKPLAKLSQVKEIRISGCGSLTDEAFLYISDFPSLRRLDLTFMDVSKRITPLAFAKLQNVRGLELLKMPADLIFETDFKRQLKELLPRCIIK